MRVLCHRASGGRELRCNGPRIRGKLPFVCLAALAYFPGWRMTRSASTTPSATMPMRRAAASDRSAIRPDTNGPRSFTTTSTLRWFSRLVTRTRVPNGSVRCAMVSAVGSNGSPLAVFLPARSLPYIEIRPRCCVLIAVSPADGCAWDGGPVGAGPGGSDSGARSSGAQPNSIAQASAATRYDDGRDCGPHAGIADSCTLNPELYNDTARTTRSTGSGGANTTPTIVGAGLLIATPARGEPPRCVNRRLRRGAWDREMRQSWSEGCFWENSSNDANALRKSAVWPRTSCCAWPTICS